MQELEKDHPPAAILKWTETEVTIHAFLSMGNILSEGGWVREAISAYDMALRLKSDYAEVYYNRGTAKALIGEYQCAVADFDEAIRLKSQFVEAHYNRGTAKLALNRREEARSDFQTALKLTEQQGREDIKANITQCLEKT
jgi:tetratricopeptide (TPR) repeat protein